MEEICGEEVLEVVDESVEEVCVFGGDGTHAALLEYEEEGVDHVIYQVGRLQMHHLVEEHDADGSIAEGSFDVRLGREASLDRTHQGALLYFSCISITTSQHILHKYIHLLGYGCDLFHPYLDLGVPLPCVFQLVLRISL